MPARDLPKAFQDMNKKYGEVVYLDVFGQPMVVLGTHESAVELLEKRSANYSDRMHSVMAALSGWEWALPLIPYGLFWRRNRRAFHEFFHPGIVPDYRTIQLEAARGLLRHLLQDPTHYTEHIRYAFGSSIMRISYGIDVDKEKVPYLTIAEDAMQTFSDAFVPGKYLVETFPLLRFLPSWFPGTKFKREGTAWTSVVNRLRDTPWDATVAAMREGTALPSIVTAWTERASEMEDYAPADEDEVTKNTAATAYAGGSDTMLSTILSFLLAMASYPEVQKKAQAELDDVVGAHRLPDFEDEESLPYISAILKECVRWRVVLPLGLIHRSLEDDVYRGYFIPKGTHVVPNAWAYTRDPRHYPDPEEFIPERFLKDGKLNLAVQDPGDIIFGYGRRVCPGRHFAEAALFAIVSSVLHTFDITGARDEHGNPVRLEVKMTEGVLS
ncbi:CyP450 monooxygenase [Trametes versicolor FP-101664 SS1]|uniref:CyP450 monooxygenase n=1 Tax=Trametes versicolor (strain FP-101664) TaxID=717944 RepID=UPI0004623DB6|nr:CyP450 monooxygenase [Trametes versicolor FP-101664 SS1]EIW53604.1 CyP450 monooxygenase [Trametes versicolor FP-101664 SS1]